MYEYGGAGFEEKKNRYLRGIYTEKNRQDWLKEVNDHFEKGLYPWDYIWQICTEGMLRIVPTVNMVSNIGFSNKSTHTFMKPQGYCPKTAVLKEPLCVPEKMEHEMGYTNAVQKSMKRHLWNKVYDKVRIEYRKMREEL